MTTRVVLVALFDGVQMLDLAGPFDVFTSASRFVSPEEGAPYEVLIGSMGGTPVRSAGGLTIVPDVDLRTAAAPDILLVPGGPGAERRGVELVDWLRAFAPRAGRIVSVCTGAYLLADAGLLDGRRATTHWAFTDDMALQFPDVRVDPGPIFVEDGNVMTSAGVVAGVDLAIAIVEADLGRRVAQEVARYLVLYLRRPGSQAQVSAQLAAQTARSDPLRAVQFWVAGHLESNLTVPVLADRAGMSTRHFARAFLAEVGVTPGRYVDLCRLEAAQRMLAESVDGVSRIAHASGYGTPEAMRRAFVRELGCSPTGYRATLRRSTVGESPAGSARRSI